MMKNLLKIAGLIAVSGINIVFAEPGVQLQLQLQELLQQMAQAESQEEKSRLQQEILKLQQEINSTSNSRNKAAGFQSEARAPFGSRINPYLQRDTYFYRGPVHNPTHGTPFLQQSWQRGYGTQTHVQEGRPQFALNHPNAYVNEIPGAVQPFRNPYTNPYQSSLNFSHYQRPGSQYFPFGHNPWMQNGYNNQYQWGRNQFYRPGFGPDGYGGFPGGYQPFPGGFGPYPRHGFPHGYGPQNNDVSRQQQAKNLATFDAQRRYEAELQINPHQTGANFMRVQVESVTTVENGQYQVTVKTSGGVTGAGVGQSRIYLYDRRGMFVRQLDQPLPGGSYGGQVTLQRYRVSNQQKFQIERWLAERGYNQYGDPIGTMYAGGNPLHQFQDGTSNGGTPGETRFNYILSKHPSLINLFNITRQ